jgi:hypothetical protein
LLALGLLLDNDEESYKDSSKDDCDISPVRSSVATRATGKGWALLPPRAGPDDGRGSPRRCCRAPVRMTDAAAPALLPPRAGPDDGRGSPRRCCRRAPVRMTDAAAPALLPLLPSRAGPDDGRRRPGAAAFARRSG